MRLYRDIITGDEMFSDVFKITESTNGILYEVEGKLEIRSEDVNCAIGGNPSADQKEEILLPNTFSGVDIVMNHKLQKMDYTKQIYKDYIKDYMKAIKAKLEETNPDRVEAFMSGAKAEVVKLLPKLKNCQYFRGESMNTDGMVVLLDYRDDGSTPYLIYFKDGLSMEKC
ncbi:hypothetical protein SKAU_G00251370 [Synaphobranchus kaupii]|uniref:Translationally-controlled tumor protein homolog n=1 Tax=Synaphobranchus kaupii TaxID=118154 RepID=A0A9Q1F2W2_SYNKA|nr:hypothetical protein SKAU_G00251370 [Synaphobranchus kaupii]